MTTATLKSVRCPTPPRWQLAAAGAWLIAGVCALVHYRKGPLLGFDPYYYCEFAKRYARVWPHAFGNDWPCGYPLLGGLLGRLGLPAYPALCLISLGALAALVSLSARLLENRPGILSLVITSSLAVVPIVSEQVFAAATELPFAAAWLGLAVALGAWPKRSALWTAGGCAVLALSLRYAGVLAFGVLVIWLVLKRRELRAAAAFGQAVLATVLATALAGGLLLWNLRVTGYLSGANRAASSGLGWSAWPRHLADLGWSLPAAFMADGLRHHLGAGSIGRCLGWGASLLGGSLCGWACLRPREPWVRSLALAATAYGAGMVALRSIGAFDALYGARTFLPILFPLGLVLAGQFLARARALVLGACLLALVAGLVSAARGTSRQIGGDVRPAVALLQARLRPDDVVLINDAALSLAAYLPQRICLMQPESWPADDAPRFLVIAAPPRDRRGTPGSIDPVWLGLAQRLVARGAYHWLRQTPELVMVERNESGSPP